MVEVKGVTQHQGMPEIQNTSYQQVKKVYSNRKLSSEDVEYYYVGRKTGEKIQILDDWKYLSPTLQEYVDTMKLPRTDK